MNPPFAPRLPFEMLDGIRQVTIRAIDPCLLQSPVQQLSGRADKRLAGAILLIPRLFANQQNPGRGAAGAEDRLDRILPERTIAALARRQPHLR